MKPATIYYFPYIFVFLSENKILVDCFMSYDLSYVLVFGMASLLQVTLSGQCLVVFFIYIYMCVCKEESGFFFNFFILYKYLNFQKQ